MYEESNKANAILKQRDQDKAGHKTQQPHRLVASSYEILVESRNYKIQRLCHCECRVVSVA